MSWPWSELGLDGPAPLDEVRRAYAKRVKEVHPEEDPEGFQRLHTAAVGAEFERREINGRAGPGSRSGSLLGFCGGYVTKPDKFRSACRKTR